jgi:glycosyltransferase involved in cell wall biosynthesis
LKAGNQRSGKNVGPLISVLMTVRNGIDHIGDAIDSILDQTLVDWELLIADNASTDGTDAYVRLRAAQDPRIVFHRIEAGRIEEAGWGLVSNLSAGLALCRGEWIAHMSAEGHAMPNRLERQLAFMLQNRDFAVASCLAKYVDADGERMPPLPHDEIWLEAYEDHAHRGEIVDLMHPGIFMRRETLAQLDGAQASSGVVDDIELLGPIFVQPEYLMECRIDANSQAASFLETVHQKHLWAEDCRHAWRAGNQEPTWEQFLWRQGVSRVRSA